jgi:mono/diheme cytochrome c family protein
MKRTLISAAALTLMTLGLSAGGSVAQTPAKAAVPSTSGAAAPVTPQATTASYQEMLNKYCVTCHNQKARIPAGDPILLDLANLKDPGADAAVWEKVVRKLGVGAMPPQGSPTPGAEELNKFRSALVASLDASAAKQNNPGHYVLHRLNRTEYANAVRDLLGVDFDVAELLPSDGGDFGFDNIASALKITPMLLEGYLTAALRPERQRSRSARSSHSGSTWMDCPSARVAACRCATTSRRTGSTCSTGGSCVPSLKVMSELKVMRLRFSSL